MRGSPAPDPSRGHDVSGPADAELERIRRELQAPLALTRPDSAAYVPILAHLSAIDAELVGVPQVPARPGSQLVRTPRHRPTLHQPGGAL